MKKGGKKDLELRGKPKRRPKDRVSMVKRNLATPREKQTSETGGWTVRSRAVSIGRGLE